MSDKQRFIIEVACNIVEVIVNFTLKVAFPFSKLESELRIRPWATDGRFVHFGKPAEFHSIDSRMQKIDAARAGLSDALSAVDELKNIAEANKRDLALLNSQIEQAEAQRQSVSGQLETLKGIAALDSESVRKVLRLPTRVSIWTERVIAFGFGVISSIVASYVYDFFVKPHL